MFGGFWKEKEKHPFTSFHFPPQQLYLSLFFSIDFKVLLYHGSRPLLTPFLLFPWPINYNHTSRCNKSSTHSLSIWFWLNFFSFPWNYGVAYDHILWASSRTREWRTASGVIFRFNIDVTSSWWRSWIARNVPSFWSWTFSNLVLSHFSELLHLDDFVASWPRFWWWTWNCLRRFLQNWKHLQIRMVFNFLR